MKALLSNRIYLEVSKDLQQSLQETLTYKIPSYNDPTNPLIIRNYAMVRDKIISIPIGRMDLIPEGHEIVDKRITVPVEFPKFKFPLRESQQEIYDKLEDNAIINAKPSWGKTFAGLAIAGKLGQKTLVVVHTVPLRNQWAREVEKVYGIKPGIIGSGKFDINSPIVIGNVQSLYNCMDKIAKEFGTVILDEMHHVSSPTFSKVVDRSYARYKIGLSGTLKRKDGKDVVFIDYFSDNIFKPAPENSMKPVIHVVSSGLHIPEGKGWALRINELMESYPYRELVKAIADRYSGMGHKLLVVADRVSFLNDCAGPRPRAVSVTGEVQEGREEQIDRIATDIDEIWGTVSIFKEGISQDILSCLVLGTPVNNEPMLEQLIGRIQRMRPGKMNPIVVDIKFDGWTGHKQFQARLGHYIRMGYDVKYL